MDNSHGMLKTDKPRRPRKSTTQPEDACWFSVLVLTEVGAWTRRCFPRNDASQASQSVHASTSFTLHLHLTTMSASAASASQPIQSTSAAIEHTRDDDVPHLGVLEEDDEFEEFAVAGTSSASLAWHGLRMVASVA